MPTLPKFLQCKNGTAIQKLLIFHDSETDFGSSIYYIQSTDIESANPAAVATTGCL